MKTTTHSSSSLFGAFPSPLRHSARAFLLATAMLLLLLLTPATTFAGSATWQTSPGSGDWNTASDWMPNTVPNASSDTATFATSIRTSVSISANTEVSGIVFNAGASAFTITAGPISSFDSLTISGVGITNNSGIRQNFVTAVNETVGQGRIFFSSGAMAGSLTVFTNNGSAFANLGGSFMEFLDTSSAANGSFTNKSGRVDRGFGGQVYFLGRSTAGNGTFINEGGAIRGAGGGDVYFLDSSMAGKSAITNSGATVKGTFNDGATLFSDGSTAGNATITNNGGAVSGARGGHVVFSDMSSAANATLVANNGLNGGTGGSIFFFGRDSTGGHGAGEGFRQRLPGHQPSQP